jgi:hypothetical protein
MYIRKALIRLFLISIAAATTVLMACQSSPTAEEIITNVQNAYGKVNTVSFEANATMAMEMTGRTDAGKIQVAMDLAGQMDIADKAMKMTGEVSTDIPDMGNQKIAMDMYMLGGWMYMKVGIPTEGEQWMKMKLDDQLWDQQQQLASQIEFLKSAVKVTLEEDEDVNGTDCYVLLVEPDMNALIDWVMAQQSSSGLNLEDIDLSNTFKNVLIREWVAKGTYLPARADIEILFEVSSEDVRTEAGDFESMTMEMKMQETFFDYGKEVIVVLPAGAQNAFELPTGN